MSTPSTVPATVILPVTSNESLIFTLPEPDKKSSCIFAAVSILPFV